MSPLATLGRGYAIARKQDAGQSIVRSAAQVGPGEALELLLACGRLECRVEKALPGDTAGPGFDLKNKD